MITKLMTLTNNDSPAGDIGRPVPQSNLAGESILKSRVASLIEDLKAEKKEAAELELTAENDIDANVYSETQITLQGVIDRMEGLNDV